MVSSKRSLLLRTLLSLTLVVAVLFAPTAAFADVCRLHGAAAAGPDTTLLSRSLLAFGSGLFVSLTPCVYPMIAITVAVFGARQTRSRAQGMLLSAAFVAGIIAVFVPLGVAAGLTGSLFGSLLQNPWVVGAIALVFVAMAASFFGAFDLALPSGVQNRLSTVGGGGYLGAFLLGLVCGPIAAPCTGPVLVSILTWIGKTQNAALGATVMGAFSIGLGLPFFMVGAFAVQLPKSGKWMVHVKTVLGLVLLVVALLLVAPVLPQLAAPARPGAFAAVVTVVAALGVALVLGAFHYSFDDPGLLPKLRKGLGVLVATYGVFLAFASLDGPASTLAWRREPLAALKAEASGQRRPMLVDFGASWCGACKELDRVTFADEKVQKAAGRFVAAKVDATDGSDPAVAATLTEHKVMGLPVVLVVDSNGKEAARCEAFVPPEELTRVLEAVN